MDGTGKGIDAPVPQELVTAVLEWSSVHALSREQRKPMISGSVTCTDFRERDASADSSDQQELGLLLETKTNVAKKRLTKG